MKLVENMRLHVIIIMCLNLIRNSLKEEINTNFVKKVTVFYFKQHWKIKVTLHKVFLTLIDLFEAKMQSKLNFHYL